MFRQYRAAHKDISSSVVVSRSRVCARGRGRGCGRDCLLLVLVLNLFIHSFMYFIDLFIEGNKTTSSLIYSYR